MKQYCFTSLDVTHGDQGYTDAILDPNDPIFQTTNAVVPKMNVADLPVWQQHNPANEKARIMREHGIKPGTPAWFALWFDKS